MQRTNEDIRPLTPLYLPSLTGYSHRTRGEALEKGFLDCLDMIELHQELHIPSGYMCDYQALGWIALSEGVPQITHAGMAMVRSIKRRRQQAQA